MPTMGYKSPIFLKYLIGFQFHWIIPPLLPVFFSSEKKVMHKMGKKPEG